MAYLSLVFPIILITYYLNYQNDTSLTKKNVSYVTLFVLIGILTLFFGLRYNVGIDYMSYYDNSRFGYYKKPQKYTNKMFEPGFLIIYGLVDYLCLPPNTIFIFSGFIIYICILYCCYKASASLCLSIFIFFCSGLFFFSMNELRQFVAVSIVFCGYRYAAKNELLKWGLSCFIASLFHKSAIFLFPFYFFNKISLSKIFINLLIVLSIVIKRLGALEILCSLIAFIPGQYSSYAEVLSWLPRNGGSGIICYLYLLIVLIVNNLCYDKMKNEKDSRFYFYIFTFGALFSNVFSDVYLVTRLLEYFIISILLVFPICINGLKKSVLSYSILFFLMAIFFANFIKYSFYSSPSALLEYHTVFNKEL